ncbi:MAG: carbamoyltransferase HypF, partial [Sphaerospermopsis kisseleviana]
QAAIEMEATANVNILNKDEETINYPWKIEKLDRIYYIDPAPMWEGILQDLKQQISPSEIAAKFHISLAIVITEIVKQLTQEHKINQVALTGGVFQNRILLEQTTKHLQKLGIEVFTHSIVPANDGGLSLGQAVIAAARCMR